MREDQILCNYSQKKRHQKRHDDRWCVVHTPDRCRQVVVIAGGALVGHVSYYIETLQRDLHQSLHRPTERQRLETAISGGGVILGDMDAIPGQDVVGDVHGCKGGK